MKRVTLAYSGGVSSSALLHQLADLPGTEVVTVTLDLGQRDALADVRDRALDLGAVRAHVVDARAEFADGFLAPAIRAGVAADRPAALAASLCRPLVARHLAAIAGMEESATAAVGGDADGRARFARILHAVAPQLELVVTLSAAADPASLTTDVVEFEDNLWSRRALHVPTGAAPTAALNRRTRPSRPTPPARIDVGIEGGVPVAINGVPMPLADLIASLETIAGVHGLGAVERAVDLPNGRRGREIVEARAAAVLAPALGALSSEVLPASLAAYGREIGRWYRSLIDEGDWFGPTRHALEAFTQSMSGLVAGTVSIELAHGACRVVSSSASGVEPAATKVS